MVALAALVHRQTRARAARLEAGIALAWHLMLWACCVTAVLLVSLQVSLTLGPRAFAFCLSVHLLLHPFGVICVSSKTQS